jgi:hypothetical protein
VRSILTASGSNREHPAASYFKILRDPRDTMENTTHLFLAVRFNCNKCHDHPFERWTQDQYYQTAAFFARVELKPDPAAGGKRLGGTAVEGATPLYEMVADGRQGEVLHDRTKAVAPPKFPYPCRYECPPQASRRTEFTAWLTSPDNPYFARGYVNRLWGYLLGMGLIEPLDDVRAGNPPTNPELLEHLTAEFVRSGFNVRHVIGLICHSRSYQLSIETNRWNEDDRINYAHAMARRLPAEVLYDAIHRATGAVSRIPGMPAGTRAAALPDSGVNLADGFLTNLGRPARESACECERSSGLQLGPVMALISGPTVEQAISDPQSALAKLAVGEPDDAKLVDKIFLRILNRPATPAEIAAALATMRLLPAEHRQLLQRRQDREQQQAPIIAQQERKRQEAVARAGGDLAAYEKQIASREAQLEQQRRQRIAQAEEAIRAYQKQLPLQLAGWEQHVKGRAVWTPLDPTEVSATGDVRLTRQSDLSVFADGPEAKAVYTVAARSNLAAVTGVKIEALTDDRLPSRGPGRAPDGNFVLSRLRVVWTPQKPAGKNPAGKKQAVVLQNAQADFSQANFGVALAIGREKGDQRRGWAVSPQAGRNHVAVFETRDNTGDGPGTFTFTLAHQFGGGQFGLGRFRVSVTNFPRPLPLEGVPNQVARILALAPERRTDRQKSELLQFYAGVDAGMLQRQRALDVARRPRPVDPRLKELRDALAEASRPVTIDPPLVQLRLDARLSTEQLAKARLTFAQDLAWALVNSPAFLFNR